MGIYAGHLLLLEPELDLESLQDVVLNLRTLLGADHPDVEALALRAQLDPSPSPFHELPMLRRSWTLLVEASIGRPELIASDLAKRATGELWSGGSWLIWHAGAPEEPSEPNQIRLSNIEEALAEDFGVMKQMRLARQGGSLSTVDASQKPKAAFQEIRVQLKPEQMRSIARRFGMPQSQVKNVLSSLEEKLSQTDQAPSLKVVFEP